MISIISGYELDGVNGLGKVEGLTVLSKVEGPFDGLTVLSKVVRTEKKQKQ